MSNDYLGPSGDAVQYPDLYVKVEAYCAFEDYQDVILMGVQEQVRHQLTRPQRARKSRSRVPGRGRSQLLLRDCHYHRFYHEDPIEKKG